MLEEVGKRHGATRGRFSISPGRAVSRGAGRERMTLRFTAEGSEPRSLIAEAEELYQDYAVEVAAAIRKIRAGELGDLKQSVQAVKDLRAALVLTLEERAKVARLGKQHGSGGQDRTLDFDAARAEIGRRLACLRDATGG